MKIAIMTQPLGKNYGGIMQAWALQQVLKRMGHEPVTIDRQADSKGRIYEFARLTYRLSKKILGNPNKINPNHHLPYILKNTLRFIEQNIVTSEPLDSTAKLKRHFSENGYEAVIVGSDQAWRPIYSPNIYNFFLDFLEDENIKRIAYATSFGVDGWEFTDEQTCRCRELAKRFDYISVRETSGVKLCHQHLMVHADSVLDPTLLLKQADYEELIGDKIKSSGTGIYTYTLDKTPQKEILITAIAKSLGEGIYSSQAAYPTGLNSSKGIEDYVMPGVREWLAGFKNAKYVLTDSFHGMVFSIIFKKPFLVVSNNERGQARFVSLLNQLDLKDRLIELPPSLKNLPTISDNINFTKVEYKLSEMREISISKIENSLS